MVLAKNQLLKMATNLPHPRGDFNDSMSSKKKPVPSFSGITLEQWQSQTDLVAWAQRDPMFRQINYVLLNELPRVTEDIVGCSEGRALGRVEGFKLALLILRSLAVKPLKEPDIPPADFKAPPENSLETPDVQD